MVFFFYGPNSYASRRQVREMMATYTKKTSSDIGLERIDGPAVDLKTLTSSLLAVPFLATSRLVVVDYLSQNKAVTEKIDQIIKAVPATTVTVFYEKEVDRRGRYFKTLAAEAKAIEFKLLTPGQLAAWVKREVRKLDATIEPAAAQELLDRTGDDQWRLEQELLKLSNFDPTITKQAVVDLVEERLEESIFGLVEAMSGGQPKLALERYQGLLAGGSNEMYVLTMIMWQLRNLLLAKTAGTIPSSQLAREAGLSPFVATKAQGAQRRFSQEQLKQAFLAGIDTEAAIKTGAGKADQLVELLIYEVATATEK